MVILKGKKFLIYGFGLSGKSCFRFLNKNNYVRIIDDKEENIPKILSKKKIIKKKLRRVNFDYIVLSPGIDKTSCSLRKYLKINSNKIINELDIFYSLCPKNKKISITGTNGKSTVVSIIYKVLKKSGIDARLVGNIGFPILSEKNIKKNTVFIIEVSSYQIEYSKYFISDIAVILNISPDHLERHKSFKNYYETKFKLIKNQNKRGISLVNKNLDNFDKYLKKNDIKSKIYKINPIVSNKIISKISNNYFLNKNNLENLKFVLKICQIFKIKINTFFETLNKFKGLQYRQQTILKKKNLIIINDSKSTSFSSSINLIKSYRNIYWILGGQSKMGDKLTLKKSDFYDVKAYIYGKDKNFFKNKLKNKIKCKKFKNLNDATKSIYNNIANDKSLKHIIFSPAAASYDQYRNFEERGKKFNLIVKKLKF
tara:strand:- start:2322 stop:3602 length:1281 start_codon:yes stop_codon:yes gene_type:complete